MRKAVWALAAAAVAVCLSGCIAVNAKGNRFVEEKGVVSVNGRVYLIDYCTGKASEVDVSGAKPFTPKCCDKPCHDKDKD